MHITPHEYNTDGRESPSASAPGCSKANAERPASDTPAVNSDSHAVSDAELLEYYFDSLAGQGMEMSDPILIIKAALDAR
jgi:hypothetical protein